ncbi:hypothetical protein [Actinomadura oligospora]|uniref:hypothetical protein n=1 Tax=Actinomadura oligospora TaxID=111804 RepID=UPI0004B7DE29|nr:hypothetical protein [Actinomadura oligospora]
MDAGGGRLRLIGDSADVADAASWVVDGMGEFAAGVRGLVPAGFEAYVRILHPAWSAAERAVRWSEIAHGAGTGVSSATRFEELAARTSRDIWDEEPRMGELPASELAALVPVLAAHTGTPGSCWFCLWDGWGWIPGEVFASAPRVRLPHRDYLLFAGPLDAATELGQRGDGYFLPQSPNLFWPDDHSWCAATEVDLDSTYVGGSSGLIGALLSDDRIEGVPVTPDDRVG